MDIEALGWDSSWDSVFDAFRVEGYEPARVIREHKHYYVVAAACSELVAELSGRMRHDARTRADLPAVGDWLAIAARPAEGRATIHAVLPRRSSFSRKMAGGPTEEQVIAANVDRALVICGLDGDFNVRRIERYLTRAWDSGASPVIVLNKADVCEDVEARVAEVDWVAGGAPILVSSAVNGQGLDALRSHLNAGITGAFLGSSGVGKSSLINALLGVERQAVQAVREDDSRGRHTTTGRELFLLPGGGIVIDTPGMRELQLWTNEVRVAFRGLQEPCQVDYAQGAPAVEPVTGILAEPRVAATRSLLKRSFAGLWWITQP